MNITESEKLWLDQYLVSYGQLKPSLIVNDTRTRPQTHTHTLTDPQKHTHNFGLKLAPSRQTNTLNNQCITVRHNCPSTIWNLIKQFPSCLHNSISRNKRKKGLPGMRTHLGEKRKEKKNV